MTSFPSSDRRARHSQPVRVNWVNVGCMAFCVASWVALGLGALWVIDHTHPHIRF